MPIGLSPFILFFNVIVENFMDTARIAFQVVTDRLNRDLTPIFLFFFPFFHSIIQNTCVSLSRAKQDEKYIQKNF